ncbi:MAG: hypothetical protein ACRDPJ_13000 [Nocardioidaceae bacterium]
MDARRRRQDRAAPRWQVDAVESYAEPFPGRISRQRCASRAARWLQRCCVAGRLPRSIIGRGLALTTSARRPSDANANAKGELRWTRRHAI